MTLIKSHSCTKCGGVLIVHNDKQQYECPYCGIFYDYEYFRLRDILEQAAASQKVLQYDSAKEKYEFILKKDPHNFIALRGILLCESGINRPELLSDPDRTVRLLPATLLRVQKMADQDGKAYFYRLSLLRELATFIRGNKQQQISLDKGAVKIYSKFGTVPLNNAQRSGELAKIRSRLSKFNKEFAKLYAQLQELEPDEVKEETKRQASEKQATYGNEKQAFLKIAPSCASCGGEVLVNLNRQVYECPFCGLTFDFDFIRDETVLSEVKDAFEKQQYVKADALYEHILAADPSNYEALRGRIMCSTKTQDLQSVMADPESFAHKVYIPAFKELSEEAFAACEDCDRPYFEGFKNLVPEIESFAVSSSPSNVHRRKKDSLFKERKHMEWEYENATKEYKVLYAKQGGDSSFGPGELTPQETARMYDLADKINNLRRLMEANQAHLWLVEEEVSKLNDSSVYAIGNIRQIVANMIRLEALKSGEAGSMDLSYFHDSEWEEE